MCGGRIEVARRVGAPYARGFAVAGRSVGGDASSLRGVWRLFLY